jgi:hypothetical protein
MCCVSARLTETFQARLSTSRKKVQHIVLKHMAIDPRQNGQQATSSSPPVVTRNGLIEVVMRVVR